MRRSSHPRKKPEIRKKYSDKQIIVGACWPMAFEDEPDIELISIAESQNRLGNLEPFSVYAIAGKMSYRGHLIDIYRMMYL